MRPVAPRGARPAGPDWELAVNIVKVGALYINLDQIAEVRDTGIDIEIFYRGSDRATTLRGSEAETLRRWLDTIAKDASSLA